MTGEEVLYESSKEIPKDLQEKINALKALATSNRLLTEVGSFSAIHFKAIDFCSAFLKDLYGRVAEDAIAHPDHELSEELVALKKDLELKAEKKDE